jgi:putative pyruvate formate lyase activating enzyme
MAKPVYLETHASGMLAHKVEEALDALAECRLCPRDCAVNRLDNAYATCLSGRQAVVSTAYPHFGEEDCLRGYAGSGTIFFGHCNLKCVFCQNFTISQRSDVRDPGVSAENLAGLMLDLQVKGCHNINFVTGEHVVPQILEGLLLAIPRGLTVPLVYNTSAYDSDHSLALLSDVIDIYMPDFKVWDPTRARRWLKAEDYPETARHSVKVMQKQVGDLVFNREGLAVRGVLVRHLIMPDGLEDTRQIMRFLAREVSPNVYVHLMNQYGPAGKVSDDKYPEINRDITSKEMRSARQIAAEEGIRRLDLRRPHPELMRRFAQ